MPLEDATSDDELYLSDSSSGSSVSPRNYRHICAAYEKIGLSAADVKAKAASAGRYVKEKSSSAGRKIKETAREGREKLRSLSKEAKEKARSLSQDAKEKARAAKQYLKDEYKRARNESQERARRARDKVLAKEEQRRNRERALRTRDRLAEAYRPGPDPRMNQRVYKPWTVVPLVEAHQQDMRSGSSRRKHYQDTLGRPIHTDIPARYIQGSEHYESIPAEEAEDDFEETVAPIEAPSYGRRGRSFGGGIRVSAPRIRLGGRYVASRGLTPRGYSGRLRYFGGRPHRYWNGRWWRWFPWCDPADPYCWPPPPGYVYAPPPRGFVGPPPYYDPSFYDAGRPLISIGNSIHAKSQVVRRPGAFRTQVIRVELAVPKHIADDGISTGSRRSGRSRQRSSSRNRSTSRRSRRSGTRSRRSQRRSGSRRRSSRRSRSDSSRRSSSSSGRSMSRRRSGSRRGSSLSRTRRHLMTRYFDRGGPGRVMLRPGLYIEANRRVVLGPGVMLPPGWVLTPAGYLVPPMSGPMVLPPEYVITENGRVLYVRSPAIIQESLSAAATEKPAGFIAETLSSHPEYKQLASQIDTMRRRQSEIAASMMVRSTPLDSVESFDKAHGIGAPINGSAAPLDQYLKR